MKKSLFILGLITLLFVSCGTSHDTGITSLVDFENKSNEEAVLYDYFCTQTSVFRGTSDVESNQSHSILCYPFECNHPDNGAIVMVMTKKNGDVLWTAAGWLESENANISDDWKPQNWKDGPFSTSSIDRYGIGYINYSLKGSRNLFAIKDDGSEIEGNGLGYKIVLNEDFTVSLSFDK